jgi:hypothetical protein
MVDGAMSAKSPLATSRADQCRANELASLLRARPQKDDSRSSRSQARD